MTQPIDIAVVGATGSVGETLVQILEELDLGQDDSVQIAVALMRKLDLEPTAQATLQALPQRANASRQNRRAFRATVSCVANDLRSKYQLRAGDAE